MSQHLIDCIARSLRTRTVLFICTVASQANGKNQWKTAQKCHADSHARKCILKTGIRKEMLLIWLSLYADHNSCVISDAIEHICPGNFYSESVAFIERFWWNLFNFLSLWNFHKMPTSNSVLRIQQHSSKTHRTFNRLAMGKPHMLWVFDFKTAVRLSAVDIKSSQTIAILSVIDASNAKAITCMKYTWKLAISNVSHWSAMDYDVMESGAVGATFGLNGISQCIFAFSKIRRRFMVNKRFNRFAIVGNITTAEGMGEAAPNKIDLRLGCVLKRVAQCPLCKRFLNNVPFGVPLGPQSAAALVYFSRHIM